MKNLLESRKSKLFLIIFAVSIIALFLDKANFVEFGEFIKWIFASYVVGNGAEHVAKNKNV
jgi:hypothetical protein